MVCSFTKDLGLLCGMTGMEMLLTSPLYAARVLSRLCAHAGSHTRLRLCCVERKKSCPSCAAGGSGSV